MVAAFNCSAADTVHGSGTASSVSCSKMNTTDSPAVRVKVDVASLPSSSMGALALSLRDSG
jgi:hypothetical protein